MWGLLIGSGHSRNRHHGFNAVYEDIPDNENGPSPPLIEKCMIVDNTGEYPFDHSEAREGVEKGYYSYKGYFRKGDIVYHYYSFNG